MSTVNHYIRSFIGGTMSAEMFGRIDDAKAQMGAAEILNMTVDPRGAVERTPGTLFVDAADSSRTGATASSSKTILVPFQFSEEDTVVIAISEYTPSPIFIPGQDFGIAPGGFRVVMNFYTQGATILDPNTGFPLRITTPFNSVEKIRWSQSADVITFVAPGFEPYELRRLGPFEWELEPAEFGPSADPPSNLTASVSLLPISPPGDIPITYEYAVSSIASDNSESDISNIVTATVDFNSAGRNDRVFLSWQPAVGATGYRVYRRAAGGGSWGSINETASTSIVDDRFSTPNFGVQPPIDQDIFLTPDDWPNAVARHQQRRWFAGYSSDPLRVDATRTGTETDFSIRVPAQDTDALRFRISSTDGSPIRHLVSVQELLAFTSAGVFKIDAVQSNALTPTTLTIQLQDNVGSTTVRPVIQDSEVLYESVRGCSIRRLLRDQTGYTSLDTTVRSRHLFERRRIVSMAFQRNPSPILWCVMDNGDVMAMTYMPAEDIYAWHKHSFGLGKVKSVAVVPEGNEDAVYFVVRYPSISTDLPASNGWVYDTIERFAPFRPIDTFNQPYMNSAMIAIDPPGPRQVLTGLNHLKGQLVQVRQNDKIHRPIVVDNNGVVTLDYPIDTSEGVVWIGRPYISRIVTMPIAKEDAAYTQSKNKNFGRVFLKLRDSLGGRAGILGDGGEVRNTIDRSNNDAEIGGIFTVNWSELRTKPDETSKNRRGDFEVQLRGRWNSQGQIAIEQREPLPFNLLGISMEVVMS